MSWTWWIQLVVRLWLITLLMCVFKNISYRTIRYRTIMYHTIPYHVVPFHTISYHTIPYGIATYRTILYRIVLYRTNPYDTLPNIKPKFTSVHYSWNSASVWYQLPKNKSPRCQIVNTSNPRQVLNTRPHHKQPSYALSTFCHRNPGSYDLEVKC